MGFEAPRSDVRIRLHFDDYDGLEVLCSASIDLGGYFALQELMATKDDASFMELIRRFADVLVGWNVEVGGKPVPADLDGLKRLQPKFAMEVILAWIGGLAEVSRPLEGRSPNGKPSPARSIRRRAARSASRQN